MPRTPKPNPPEEPAPGADFQPADVLFIKTPEMLRAVSDPLRLDILELLHEKALTVKQMADRLGEPPTRLYYHVAALEEAGFVTQVDTRVKSGILEKYYRASAENITVERRLLNAGDEPSASPPEMLAALLSTVFDTTVEDLRRSFAAGLIPAAGPAAGPAAEPGSGAGEAGSGPAAPLVLSRSLVSLPKEKAAAFIERFNGLLKEIDAEDQGGGGAESYGCTVAFYPRVKAGGAQAPEEKNMGRG
jgi:DNA-binding transcriptional ArsR family regulator